MDKKLIVYRVNEWADWLIRTQDSSPIGYPSRSTEGRLMVEGGRVDGPPPRSIVPLTQMPARIAEINNAIKTMRELEAHILKYHHLTPGKATDNMRVYCKTHHIGKRKYHVVLDKAYCWIGGAISRNNA